MSYCEIIKLPEGGTAIVCMGGKRPVRCHFCGRTHTKLCDYPRGQGTCDLPLCDEHARSVGPNRDYCFNHPHTPNLL